ncbi:MAG TPA: M13 family metallopeptidase [Bryobacteraceae bacterium]|nr:M13 family metallopeptidase [Bryobacteraceae bacterium]
MNLFAKCALLVSLAVAAAAQSFTPAFMDKTADPCSNFYQYACGVWQANNPVPADHSRWGRFEELLERNQRIMREILEASAAASSRGPIDQKIGDYYASCMDEAAIEAKSLAPLKPELDRIEALKSAAELPALVAHLHGQGAVVLFAFGSQADMKNSTENIAAVYQGGLGLPDRDYYLNEDARSVELRTKYLAHVRKMFELAGTPAAEAAAKAQAVLAIETSLARASLDRVSRRDPYKNYNKLSRKELAALSPSFDWSAYIAARSTPAFDGLNVQNPGFVRNIEALVKSESLDSWKAYLTWQVLHMTAATLPKAFVDEDFDFFGRTLAGQKELRPRWNRCVAAVDADLGEALGQKYVEKTFPPEAKKRMLDLVASIEDAMRTVLEGVPWMTAETRKRALEKLHAVANKIGYPDKWRDYTALRIVRGDALGNSLRGNAFATSYNLSKIGKPVDPTEWSMTPPTVNAYYSPTMNNINFPAGILQPPFFDLKADDAVNYGGIGAVIAHELTHGFDDQGRKYDARGNLTDWWTEQDGREFEKRSQCFVDQYAEYTAVGDVKLNGKLTLGENVADNGGLRLAYMALMDTLAGVSRDKIEGFTPEQRLFLSWGQVWCQNVTEERARLQAATGPHSPGQYRVNGVVSNMPEFQKAFGCAAGQPMVRQNACRVW